MNDREPRAPATDGRSTALRLGVWQLAWPSMTLFGLHSLVGLVDLLFVSTVSTEAVAGVGIAMQTHFLVFALFSAITAGTVALTARSAGAGRWREVGVTTRASVLLVTVLATALMGLIPFARTALALLGVAPEVAALGGECLATLLAFNVPLAVGLTVAMALRSAGDVRTPLLVGVLANLVNVVADYALIFGHFGAPALGAPGSALASGLAYSVEMALLLVLWARQDLIIPRVPWRSGLSGDLVRRLLRVGLPTAGEQSAFNGGILIFLGLVAGYGTDAVSAYLIGVRILALCFVPGFGFATAASTLVGQHLGAGDPAAAARMGWRSAAGAIGVLGGVGLVIVLLARPIAGWFGAAGDATVELTVTFIYILGAAQPFMAVEFALGGALRGAGDTRFPLIALLIGLFAFRLGLAVAIAGPVFGTVTAVWCCLLADYAVKAALLSWRYASGRWQEIDL